MLKKFVGYSVPFVTFHVITYTLIGIVFLVAQDYATAFTTESHFALFRPLDDPWVAAALPMQIIRGLVLAPFLYPLYPVYASAKHGWLLLFLAMYGLTALVSPVLLPDLVATITTSGLRQGLLSLVVGLPEITVQMLAFAWLFCWWKRRRPQRAVPGVYREA